LVKPQGGDTQKQGLAWRFFDTRWGVYIAKLPCGCVRRGHHLAKFKKLM